jgi:exopolyphosphatase / guanosine-5'-triphosphate,3'-diphosphate pyrophosphatase
VSRLASLVRRDPPRKGEMRDLRQRVEEAVAPARSTLEELAPPLAVAVGGTVRNLARVAAADTGTWVPVTINQLTVPTGEVAGLRDRLVELDTDERTAVPGMKDKRADRAHVAAAILAATLETLGIDEVVVSDWGLREGLLLEAMGAVVPPTREGLRRREVERVQDGFSPDVAHVTHVANLAVRLFDEVPDLHGLDPADRELLWCGAALHDVGESLALRAHHRHGAYVLEHAEMRGFAPTETAMLCSMVRFHTSRGLSTSFAPYGALRRRDRRRVEAMVALLQVADGLDRTRDQAVTGLHVEREDGVVELVLDGEGLHLARTELDRRTALFARTFGVDVRVREAVSS